VIDPRAFKPLVLGGRAIEVLLPHRPPLLLVDRVSAFSSAPPALRASREISPGEPVFIGHFPDLKLWPGAYTIEGLAQACALLGSLERVDRDALARWDEDGGQAPFDREAATAARNGVGMLVAADVKLTRPVLAGDRLDYLVLRAHQVGEMHRFEVEASAGGRLVARGRLTCALRGAP
jgi:3-hydroxymyristoyl/3-hydroxydecanoyl-(acyl carrier protein) dehydratase